MDKKVVVNRKVLGNMREWAGKSQGELFHVAQDREAYKLVVNNIHLELLEEEMKTFMVQ